MNRERAQYNLVRLFAITTAAAVLFAALRYQSVRELAALVAVGVAFFIIPLIGASCLLIPGWRKWPIVFVVVSVAVFAQLMLLFFAAGR